MIQCGWMSWNTAFSARLRGYFFIYFLFSFAISPGKQLNSSTLHRYRGSRVTSVSDFSTTIVLLVFLASIFRHTDRSACSVVLFLEGRKGFGPRGSDHGGLPQFDPAEKMLSKWYLRAVVRNRVFGSSTRSHPNECLIFKRENELYADEYACYSDRDGNRSKGVKKKKNLNSPRPILCAYIRCDRDRCTVLCTVARPSTIK